MTTKVEYVVVVRMESWTGELRYGPFSCREAAEQCVVQIAGRPNIFFAQIDQMEPGETLGLYL